MVIRPARTSADHRTWLGTVSFVLIALLWGVSCPTCVLGQAGAPAAPATANRNVEPVAQGEAHLIRVHALRLGPGQDLRGAIENFAKTKKIRAGFIITTVGSLDAATLRLADQSDPTHFAGKFEIVSLGGTLSPDGVHLHLSLSDATGRTIGGHLVPGCRIYTTAEILIGEARGLVFNRQTDRVTGYIELTISPTMRAHEKRH